MLGTSHYEMDLFFKIKHKVSWYVAPSSALYIPVYRLQTTIDFLIHLSYKTGHFGGLYKIP